MKEGIFSVFAIISLLLPSIPVFAEGDFSILSTYSQPQYGASNVTYERWRDVYVQFSAPAKDVKATLYKGTSNEILSIVQYSASLYTDDKKAFSLSWTFEFEPSTEYSYVVEGTDRQTGAKASKTSSFSTKSFPKDFKITDVRVEAQKLADGKDDPSVRNFTITFNYPARAVNVSIAKNTGIDAVWKTTDYNESLYQQNQKSFALMVSSLVAGMEYKYTVSGQEPTGGHWAPEMSGTFYVPLSTSKKQLITNVSVTDITTNGATFLWTTDLPSSDLLYIGESASSMTPGGVPGERTSHAVTWTHFKPDTTYYYRIEANDGANTTKTETSTFKTKPIPGSTVLAITNVEVQQLGDTDVGTRDFSYNVNTQNKTTATLTIKKTATSQITFKNDFTGFAPYVSGLEPSTTYTYAIDIVDQVTGAKGHTEGTFTTGSFKKAETGEIGVELSRIYQAGQTANEETLSRDFAFYIKGVADQSGLTKKLEIYNVVTGKKHPEQHFIQAHSVVSALQHSTTYRYVYTVTDSSTGRTGRAEGLFETAHVAEEKKQHTAEEKKITGDQQIADIKEKADLLQNSQIDKILSELNELRNKVKEQESEIMFLKKVSGDLKQLSEQMQQAIGTFVTYGIDANTKNLGAGERAAVVNSFKAAYDKLPETDQELQDLFRIANGRFPSTTNANAEKEAKVEFRKIYKRVANMKNPNDSAAVTVMAYGLRQAAENRNLKSESAGIAIFNKIYGHTPQTTEEWNIMQAITYSGASRKSDADKDFLSDEDEKLLGTDPNKRDSDGDSYSDGDEVENGYNPLGA